MIQKELLEDQKKKKRFEIIKRNTAIADLLGFKKYIPNHSVLENSINRELQDFPIKWYVIPDVGRYSNFELKFNLDWNWLMSAVIEFIRKYEKSHIRDSHLDILFKKFSELPLHKVSMEYLWYCLSEYALKLNEQKIKENNDNKDSK